MSLSHSVNPSERERSGWKSGRASAFLALYYDRACFCWVFTSAVLAQGPVLPFVVGPDASDLTRAWVAEGLPEDGGSSYVAASYVKFIQASGDKVRRVLGV